MRKKYVKRFTINEAQCLYKCLEYCYFHLEKADITEHDLMVENLYNRLLIELGHGEDKH